MGCLFFLKKKAKHVIKQHKIMAQEVTTPNQYLHWMGCSN